MKVLIKNVLILLLTIGMSSIALAQLNTQQSNNYKETEEEAAITEWKKLSTSKKINNVKNIEAVLSSIYNKTNDSDLKNIITSAQANCNDLMQNIQDAEKFKSLYNSCLLIKLYNNKHIINGRIIYNVQDNTNEKNATLTAVSPYTIKPSANKWWTGYARYSSIDVLKPYATHDGDIDIGKDLLTGTKYRGYMVFDISKIPPNAIIDDIYLHAYTTQKTYVGIDVTVKVKELSVDPLGGPGDEKLYNDIGSGKAINYMGVNWFAFSKIGPSHIRISTGNLSDRVHSGNSTWAIGLQDIDYQSGQSEINPVGIIDGWSSSNPPYCEITYHLPSPSISSLSPSTKLVGGSNFTLTINGKNFVSGSKVQWNGSERPTTYVSSTQLKATIYAGDIRNAATEKVTVTNSDGSSSAPAVFTVENPTPSISYLFPSSAPAGTSGFIMKVYGSNFVKSSEVKWNGSKLSTTYVSVTQLKATILTSNIANAGTDHITVYNPSPGGGTSNSITFQVNPPAKFLNISTTSLTLDTTSGSSGSFNVNSNISWNASSNKSWLNVSPKSGSNNGPVKVTATSANTSASPRSGTVTVSGSGLTKSVSITQKGAKPTLSVSPPSITLNSKAGSSGQFKITSNTTWAVSCSNEVEGCDWLEVSPNSGSDNKTITVTAKSTNDSTASRSKVLLIVAHGGELNSSVDVMQQGTNPVLSVLPDSIDLGVGNAGTPFDIAFFVKNTGDGTLKGTVTTNAKWISSITPPNFSVSSPNSTKITVQGVFPSTTGSFRDSVKITSNGGNDYVIFYGSIQSPKIQITINNGKNWQMIGDPVSDTLTDFSNLFPKMTRGTKLYAYINGQYSSVDSLRPGQGYWIRFDDASSVTYKGNKLDSVVWKLEKGWNMVSGTSDSMAFDLSNYLLLTSIWSYNGSYQKPDSLKPGYGYWVNASNSGNVTIKPLRTKKTSIPLAAAYTGSKQNANLQSTDETTPVTLSIRDDVGHQMQLLIGNGQGGAMAVADQYLMPPRPPSGMFDARFSTGYQMVSGKDGKVEIQGVQNGGSFSFKAPKDQVRLQITVSDPSGQRIADKTLSPGQVYSLPSDPKLSVKIHVTSEQEIQAALPKQFELQQNYPNPFNPTTTIRYGLPEKSNVKLTVFNILGRKIETLVSGSQKAGWHEVRFDAHQLASGLYIYRLTAGDHVVVRKLMLIK